MEDKKGEQVPAIDPNSSVDPTKNCKSFSFTLNLAATDPIVSTEFQQQQPLTTPTRKLKSIASDLLAVELKGEIVELAPDLKSVLDELKLGISLLFFHV